MFTKTTIALSAALVLVLGAATTPAATAKSKARANNPAAAFALSGPGTLRTWSPVQYDTSGVAITPTRRCPLSLAQQSRC